MAREVKHKQIGKFHYRVKMLPDPLGMKLLIRLMRILTPVLGAGLKGLPDDGKGIGLANLTTAAIGDALMTLADFATEDDMQFIYESLTQESDFSEDKQTWYPMTSDTAHWSGRYLEKFQWIVFAMETNYSDFLGGTESLVRLANIFQSARRSSSPDTSTGELKES